MIGSTANLLPNRLWWGEFQARARVLGESRTSRMGNLVTAIALGVATESTSFWKEQVVSISSKAGYICAFGDGQKNR